MGVAQGTAFPGPPVPAYPGLFPARPRTQKTSCRLEPNFRKLPTESVRSSSPRLFFLVWGTPVSKR